MIARFRRSPFPELGLFGVAGVLMFAYDYLDDVARDQAVDPLVPFIEEVTGVLVAGLLFFVVRRLARRVPIDRQTWPHAVAVHAFALLVFSVTHTSLNWASREVLFRLAGLGDYDYGRMPVRYFMEFPIDIIIYTCFVAGVRIVDRSRAAHARALGAAHLESRLSEARLQNLQLKLQPHFLFNALNTISSTMYDDPAAADAMLARLADLLRYSLRTAQVQEVPLEVELEALDHYVALLEARFGGDFTCVRVVDAAVTQARVPSFVLQPLVENAVRHGSLATTGRGRVAVHAKRDGDWLCLEVEDDGPGAAPGRPLEPAGIGLAATAERLRLLYGERHEFETGRVVGGFRVRMRLPWTLADEPGGAAVGADRCA